jgi:hypothetical protein
MKGSVRAYIAAGALMNAAVLVTVGLLIGYLGNSDSPPPAKTAAVVPQNHSPTVGALE